MKAAIEEVKRQVESIKMLTEAEASEMFNIPRCTLRCWRNRQRGPRYFKSGRTVRYRVEDIDAYLVGEPRETLDSVKLEA